MADIELIIKIPKKVYNAVIHKEFDANLVVDEMRKSIVNGTPLDKHDEEVIAETVESIWGKPPYIEVLDKIRAEIDVARFIDKDIKLCKNANASGLEVAMQIIDKYRGEENEDSN